MVILPLKFIREEDKKTVGLNLFHLARLNHNGLPVVESVVVVPPVETFKKLIEKYKKNFHNLKDHINNLTRSFMELEIPVRLKDFSHDDFLKKERILTVDVSVLWRSLLQKWSTELISKIERGELNLLDFTPQLIVFSSNFSATGAGFFDEDRGHVVININKGKLEFKESEEIERIILAANKKLLLPQIYFWVIEEGKRIGEGGIKIIKVAPFTQSPAKAESKTEQTAPAAIKKPARIKTATKIFLDFKDEVPADLDCDGVLLRIKDLDADIVNDQITKLLNLQNGLSIIFYPEPDMDNIKYLEFAKIFLFFRNKKKLNASVVLPRVFSKDEYIKLKTDFASIGIYSKGSLKIWKEFETVQDFLNLDDYLDAGFDGAVIDLDKIVHLVTGVGAEIFLKEPKIDRISSVVNFFIELGFQKLIKNHKQVIVLGQSLQNEEILNYFIKSGVWGIAFKTIILSGIKNHIAFIEKQTVKKLIRS